MTAAALLPTDRPLTRDELERRILILRAQLRGNLARTEELLQRKQVEVDRLRETVRCLTIALYKCVVEGRP